MSNCSEICSVRLLHSRRRGRLSRLGFLAVLLAAITCTAVVAAPFVPVDDAQVLERLPIRANDPVARELRALRAVLAADPNNTSAALDLAWRYFELATAEGDPRYIGYAEAALGPWWTLVSPPQAVLTLRGVLRQYKHEFGPALTDLAAATAADPTDVNAWSWRAAIHLVQADYSASRADCEGLRPHASALRLAGCIASVDGVSGRARAAHHMLASALAQEKSAPPGLKLWMHTRLAEFSQRLGEHAQAERHFKLALAQGVTDQFLLAAYADLLLDAGRGKEVLVMLKESVRSDVLLLRLALAAKATGSKELTEYADALQARFDAAALRGDKLHLQEQARFLLHVQGKPREALAVARENWRAEQREPRDARILLEAALAAGDAAGAAPALQWLSESAHEDPLLRQLAGRLEKLP
ncbi:MAG: hypothetical protein NT115_14810 [Proteobacteria bacterium]|nr:hypothetical protein [Pseudomonadota bacterium]